MNPGELLYFFAIGFVIVMVSVVLWLIFRKRKKLAITLSSTLIIGYIGYILYYPTLKTNHHAEAYKTVSEYLEKSYPDMEFRIAPKQYEAGYVVGDFQVHDIETPKFGVMLRVGKDDQVTQIGSWSKNEYPTPQELWREIEFTYGEAYTLGKESIDIVKQDEWLDGQLIASALTINDLPAIALFNYSKEGYGLLELREGERGNFVAIEKEGFIFVYTDEQYQGKTVSTDLENGKEFIVNVDQQKGRLIVEKQQ
ncbi:hypothetical protein [Sporosarcina sp. P2]|uniref:hypothetical protein n=1 Tax=Sporosarcina sp. P2 TaxID=2048251 RepID=UPI0018ED2933|nr:hypothetical protein [Sporosarcina sp. P2]